MARSKQTSQKTEKEKKKRQKHKEKEEKRALRKANSNKGKGFDSMMAYVDHNGQLSDTPPDPRTKAEIRAEEILLGPQSFTREEIKNVREGRVAIYNNDRRFGFIKDSITHEKTFFHISDTDGDIKEGDIVSYELMRGPKGLSAVNVTKLKPE